MAGKDPTSIIISRRTLQRLPFYLNYLKQKQAAGMVHISSVVMANDLGLNEVQVRKDIACVTTVHGKPKTGHILEELIDDITSFLGYNNTTTAVLVGAGQLGKALLSYKGFDEYGLEIVVAFDRDARIIGSQVNEKKIYAMEQLKTLCERMHIHIGIITVSKDAAQAVCDELVAYGIKAIWNFAPVHLQVPSDVILQNENMASSLAVLSRRLAEKNNQ